MRRIGSDEDQVYLKWRKKKERGKKKSASKSSWISNSESVAKKSDQPQYYLFGREISRLRSYRRARKICEFVVYYLRSVYSVYVVVHNIFLYNLLVTQSKSSFQDVAEWWSSAARTARAAKSSLGISLPRTWMA